MSWIDDANPTELDTCGCHSPGTEKRNNRNNRPGKPEISYRLGTHGSFLAQMIAQIPQPALADYPTLEALKTRRLDDSAIALLDAWAVVADVLTFYQERIANENYLSTATERRSVLELARAIGYELNPGVAASTYLSFTVETSPGSPEVVPILKGTQVFNIPGPDELPQTFETMEDFTARPEWNQLRPRLSQPQVIAFTTDQLYLWTTDTDLAPLLQGAQTFAASDLSFLSQAPSSPTTQVTALPVEQLYLQGISLNLKAGQRLLFVGSNPAADTNTLIKTIRRVTQQPKENWTRIDFTAAPKPVAISTFPARPGFINPIFSGLPTTLPFNSLNTQIQLNQPILEGNLQALLNLNQWGRTAFEAEAKKQPTPIEVEHQGVFVLRQQLNCFGHNAPRYETLPAPEGTRGTPAPAEETGPPPTNAPPNDDPYTNSWDKNPPTVWENSRKEDYSAADIYLERSVPEISPDSWLLLEKDSQQAVFQVQSTVERSLVDYAISGKSTGLSLTTVTGEKLDNFTFRETTIYAQSEKLPLSALPIEAPIEVTVSNSDEPMGAQAIELDTLILGFQPGQPLLVQGNRQDAQNVTAAEAVTLKEIVHEGTNTTLYFNAPLQHRYVRSSTIIYGNVVLATHGESIAEIIGSGNGSQSHQTFTLKKPPLTYVSADRPSGSQSSLSIRVNDILWSESRAFYGLASDAENYIVRIEDDGTTKVTFGDSHQGTRLPTGAENITAFYRSGIGPAGEVPANSLTLLKKKPLGIQQVNNLLPAAGAEAPEQLANARSNAPLTVLTLDRIVSSQDYEDFANAFAGIGKASATELWTGSSNEVFITIAAANGSPVTSSSPVYRNLASEINKLRDPGPTFTLASFSPRAFNASAKLQLNPRYPQQQILNQVKTVLLMAFSFSHRSFAQGVSAAEVIRLMQAVSGVVAVDLDQLYRSEEAAPNNSLPVSYLPAAAARWNAQQGTPTPAELLLINPAGITLEAFTS
ncbi:MAG: putative baseplate assembly protein [Cyanobacteria bacterium J06581_3]